MGWEHPSLKQRGYKSRVRGNIGAHSRRPRPREQLLLEIEEFIFLHGIELISILFRFLSENSFFLPILVYSTSLMHLLHSFLLETAHLGNSDLFSGAPAPWRLLIWNLLEYSLGLLPPTFQITVCQGSGPLFCVYSIYLTASSATSGLRLLNPHFLAHSSPPNSSPIAPYSFPQDVSTATSPWLLPPSCGFRKPSSSPVCSGQQVLWVLMPLSVTLTHLTHLYPQFQAPSCAWVYVKLSLTLVSPSLFYLPPLLPAPLTSCLLSWTPPHPSLPTSL